MRKLNLALMTLCVAASPLVAQEAAVIQLPEPDKTGGKPVMETLNNRKTLRAYSEKEISNETLSSLLWAGFGVNRDDGRRTAPTARNSQDMTIYLLTPKGAFMYDAKANTLVTRSTEDARDAAVPQQWGKKAPLILYFVQTFTDESNRQANLFGAMHAGSIYQNISLFNASVGLGDCVVATFNNDAARKALNLPDNQRIIVGQIVGYPQE